MKILFHAIALLALSSGIIQVHAANDYLRYDTGRSPDHRAAAPATDRYTAIEVQKALGRKGYYYGAADGMIGPQSREAIRHYQRSVGLAGTGQIDEKLLRSLHISGGDSRDRYQSREPERRHEYEHGREYGRRLSIEMQVQAELARKGFYHGTVDGAIGPRSQEAIRHYQHSHRMRPTGLIDDALLRSLGLR